MRKYLRFTVEEWLGLPWWQQAMYLEQLQDDPQVRRDRSVEEGEDAGTSSGQGRVVNEPPDPGRNEGEASFDQLQEFGIQAAQVPSAGG